MSEAKPSVEQIITGDGSHTLHSKRFNEHYHSSFGAIQESMHIFIDAALGFATKSLHSINLFEVGFGTGLNALLAYKFAIENKVSINYCAVEAFPVETGVIKKLNYPELLQTRPELFWNIHTAINQTIIVSDTFKISVLKKTLQDYIFQENRFDVVFFDAFSPETQPEMWQQSCFDKLYAAMKRGGVLTTYSSKGMVKRALKAAGFYIEKLPGPPGKREFLRARK